VLRWDQGQGIIPMISWAGASTRLVSAGVYDGMIRADALQLRALRKPVMLRWFAEMDGIAKHSLAGSPGSFIAAWRHVHDIFSRAGASNVTWVWCPNAFHFADGVSQAYYPGSRYVGWICADGYNWAPARPRASWASVDRIFAAFYHWGRSTGKPMMIGEYGVLERGPGQKAAWFRQADQELRTQLTAIKAVVYFNSVDSGMNWRVTSSPASLAAFRAFARDPYFGSRVAVG
jgi:beta-mannanase